jgi:HSP20 family protein
MTEQELTTQDKQEVKAEEHTRPGRTYVPNVDISETENALWLRADMPGVKEDSIEISVEKNVLSIEGQVALQEYEDLAPVYTKYNVGNYQRRFTLSNAIDADKIHARLTSGVLELELPKAESAKPRRVAVQVG